MEPVKLKRIKNTIPVWVTLKYYCTWIAGSALKTDLYNGMGHQSQEVENNKTNSNRRQYTLWVS